MAGTTGVSIQKTGLRTGLVWALSCWAGCAWAIPSPELVIGSVSSVSQLLALGAAMLGGGAVLAGARTQRRAVQVRRRAQLRWAAIALFVLCLSLAWANYWQYREARSGRLERLQATLVRPAQFDGTEIKDEALREMSFAAQSGNRLSITTREAAELLKRMRAGKSQALFIDVRENGENQMGTLPMSRHVRFPDLQQNPTGLAEQKVVLFCHNGNRSSESCEQLAKQGVDCRFIAGGIEKWIVEGREFTDETVRSLADLRAIPDYPNRDALLDTRQIKTLLKQEDIQFLDVRYPGDFAAQHLPGAVNIPLRALPTLALTTALGDLPDKPIVAACYDRRSCFISQVLGLELSRRGYDFRGRYTVPWEYFVAPPPKPHIAAWKNAAQQTRWQTAVNALALVLNWAAERSHIVLAVAGLALASRLLILPIAIKAERDQIRLASIKPELARLKTNLKEDPLRLSRAIRAFYKRHGLTPMRNLLALVFLPLMMLGLAAVQQLAATQGAALLWIGSLGQPDPTFLLPVMFTLLSGVYLQRVLATTTGQKILCWVLGGPLLFGLVFRLTALGNIYLCFALLLLLIQRGFVSGTLGHGLLWLLSRYRGWKITTLYGGIIPLSATDHLAACGNKTLRLSQMLNAGLDVPDGVVLDNSFLSRFCIAESDAREGSLDQIWRMVGKTAVAVRSSAAAEDGASQSYAGIFESQLDVDRSSLGRAIVRVRGSFSAERAVHYAAGDAKGGHNILIQQMVDADYAGVLFTRDPQAAGMLLLEYVSGTADDLVSGRVTPTTLRIGRNADTIDTDCPVDLGALRDIGMQVERLFGAPQDIEWVCTNGRIQLVQSRDITASGAHTEDSLQIEAEWCLLTDRFGVGPEDEIVLEMDEMSEVLPRPTPLSLSYMQQIWAPGGSVDLACRRLGLRYEAQENAPSHLMTVFGRLYSDAIVKARNAVLLNAAAVRRLKRADAAIEQDYRQVFLPEFHRKLQIWNALNFSSLDLASSLEQLEDIYREFLHWTHVEIEMINIAASYFSDEARLASNRTGLNAQELLTGQGGFSAAGLLQQAAAKPDDIRRQWLHQQMGHRSVFDYELSEPRYCEMPDTLDQLLRPSIVAAGLNHAPPESAGLESALRRQIDTAQRYQSLKEEAKHYALKHLAVIRRSVLALDRFLGGEGLVFFLTFQELFSLTAETDIFQSLARSRRDHHRLLGKVPPLPPSMTRGELEQASNPYSDLAASSKSSPASWVSESGPISGRAYVASVDQARDGADLPGFEKGDILLCEMVHPAWMPHVLQAGAVVSEVGGWLSHMAIVAREYNVPMLVGASGLADIDLGKPVRIDAEGVVTQDQDSSEIYVAHIAE
ncbi:MAG: PEP-utilizing protein [Rhodobacteraceae bacterium]|nr:PEP-utilizing protein [Paracoccaceae bacterium]